MSETFQCPACKKSLQFEGGDMTFQTCRHCKGKIIVPSTVIHQADNSASTSPDSDILLRKQKLAEINSKLQKGRKIDAIKVFRETFGTDLLTAKEAVEAMQDETNINQIQKQNDERIYANQSASKPGSARAALVVIWLLITLGIALAVIFLSD